MKTNLTYRRLRAAAFGLAALTSFGAAFAQSSGETAQNRPYVTGGVSIEEARALEQQRNDYRLWLVTADRGSGAWLAGAKTRVKDARGEVVLDTVLEGPYLLVDLAPGRYTIEAEVDGRTRTQTVSIGSSGTRQVVMYFDTAAELSPDMPDRQVAAPIDDGGAAAANAAAGSTPR
jgi:hypothetical protein